MVRNLKRKIQEEKKPPDKTVHIANKNPGLFKNFRVIWSENYNQGY